MPPVAHSIGTFECEPLPPIWLPWPQVSSERLDLALEGHLRRRQYRERSFESGGTSVWHTNQEGTRPESKECLVRDFHGSQSRLNLHPEQPHPAVLATPLRPARAPLSQYDNQTLLTKP